MENHHVKWENYGKLTISMAMFNSYVRNCQRIIPDDHQLRLEVQVTILGKLGYSNANPSKEEKTEMKDKARTIRWL